MSVPDYQTLMLPVLKLAGPGLDLRVHDAVDALASEFALTPDDRLDRIASGKPKITNRVEWAITYLVHAGLLVRPSRGRFRITERGATALKNSPSRIDNVFLSQYEEFRTFRTPSPGVPPAGVSSSGPLNVQPNEVTPDEMVEEGYGRLRRETEAALLQRLFDATPEFFEQAVVDLLVAMGFGGSHDEAARRIGRTGDEGVDGVIDEDALGLDAVYIQAKRWKGSVGSPELQGFVGSLVGKKATKGVFLTTSTFTAGAKRYVDGISHRVVLIDGEELARLMFDRGVGVRTRRTYQVKEVDTGYFNSGE